MSKYIVIINELDINNIIKDRVTRYEGYYSLFDNIFIIESDKTEIEIYNEIVRDYEYTRIVICQINSEHSWGRFNKELWNYLNI